MGDFFTQKLWFKNCLLVGVIVLIFYKIWFFLSKGKWLSFKYWLQNETKNLREKKENELDSDENDHR